MNNQKYKTIRLITTKSAHCPAEFSLAHRRIFSFLSFRSRLGLGDSQREISRQTATDPRTTKNVLAFLAERKLAEYRDGKWFAQEPDEESHQWFAGNNNPKYNKHWSDQFCYSTFFVPRKGAKANPRGTRRFSVNHAHVYSILASQGRSNKQKPGVVERIGVSRLSKFLNGLSPKTIRSSLGLLESIGLLVCYQEGSYETIHVKPIGKAHAHLFEKAVPKERSVEKPPSERPQEVQFRNEEMQAIYQECRREGMSIPLAKEITVAAALAGVDGMSFDGYSEQAALEHAKSRMAGKVSVEHPGYLLKYKLEKVREEQDRAEERMMSAATSSSHTPSVPKAQPPQESKCSDQTVVVKQKEKQVKERRNTQREMPSSEDFSRRVGHKLRRTWAFLRTKLGRVLTAAAIVRSVENRDMVLWFEQGWISPFYLAVSPEVKEALGESTLAEVFGKQCKTDFTKGQLDKIRSQYTEIFGVLPQGRGSECSLGNGEDCTSISEAAPIPSHEGGDVGVVVDAELAEEIIGGVTRKQFQEALAGL